MQEYQTDVILCKVEFLAYTSTYIVKFSRSKEISFTHRQFLFVISIYCYV